MSLARPELTRTLGEGVRAEEPGRRGFLHVDLASPAAATSSGLNDTRAPDACVCGGGAEALRSGTAFAVFPAGAGENLKSGGTPSAATRIVGDASMPELLLLLLVPGVEPRDGVSATPATAAVVDSAIPLTKSWSRGVCGADMAQRGHHRPTYSKPSARKN
jgi:hypothetical protein